jgi:hypothetical protein
MEGLGLDTPVSMLMGQVPTADKAKARERVGWRLGGESRYRPTTSEIKPGWEASG